MLGIVLLFEIAGAVLRHYNINNNILDHLYQPIEFTLLSVIYYHAISHRTFRKLIKFIVGIFILVSVLSSVWVEGIFAPNTISFIIGSTFIIFYSIVFMFQLYTLPPTAESLLVNPFFWINTAHLFFYCGTFFQMGLDSYLRKQNEI